MDIVDSCKLDACVRKTFSTILVLSLLFILPLLQQMSWVSPASPKASSFFLGSRYCQTLPLLSLAMSLPLSSVPHSFALSFDGTLPGSKILNIFHQFPSNQAPGQKKEHTFLPSYVVSLSCRNSKWKWKPLGVDQKNTHFHSDYSHHILLAEIHGYCSLWAFLIVSLEVCPKSSTALHGWVHQHLF